MVILREFREFAVKGNVIDLAVGVIIGGAFSKITSSLVSDVVMPPLGLLLGKVDFSNLYLDLSGTQHGSLAEARQAGAVTLNYGAFISTVFDFVILAFVVFMLVRGVNTLRRAPTTAPERRDCPHCRSSIPLAATRCAFCTSSL